MQLTFALSLSFDGIAMLRRMPDGWAPIGEVALDSADLDGDMARLMKSALAIHRGARRVGLVIPNAQIRYLDLPELAGDEEAREAAIHAALQRETPYLPDQLVYDVSTANGRTMVAAVARETLQEAESFAKSHGFVPAAFVAMAPPAAFEGAVFFGPAPSWTGPRTPERPRKALRLIAATDAAFEPTATGIETGEPSGKPNFLSQPKPEALREQTETVTEKSDASIPEPDAVADDAPDHSDTKTDTAVKPAQTDARDAGGDETEAAEPEQNDAESDRVDAQQAVPDADEIPPIDPVAVQVADPTEQEAPVRQRAHQEPRAEEATEQSPVDQEPARPIPELQSPAAPPPLNAPALKGAASLSVSEPEAPKPGFTTVRASREADKDSAAPKLGAAAGFAASSVRRFMPVLKPDVAVKGANITGGQLDNDEDAAAKADDDSKASGLGFFSKRRRTEIKSLGFGKKAEDPSTETPDLASGQTDTQREPAFLDDVPPMPASALTAQALARKAPEATTASKATLQRLAAIREAAEDRSIRTSPRNEATLVTATAAASAASLSAREAERERMTVFGQRNRDQIGGKPRYLGLMLTSALLLLLIGVAAWASVFMDEGLARFFRAAPEEPAIAAAPEPIVQELDVRPVEEAREEPPEDPPVQVAALDTAVEETEPAPAPLSVPRQPTALTAEEAAATYAATGIWQRAPSAPAELPVGNVDNVYVASIDPAVEQFDAVALPQARLLAPGVALEDPGLPPPAGMVFDMDERGLVRATPEGALSPEGLRVFAGRPPVIPPLRESATAPEDALAPDAPAVVDAALAAFRPNIRPSDLLEQRERAELGGISRQELGRIRPTMRPRTAQEDAAIEAPDAPATDQAVVRSLQPVTRPRNMEAIVRRADRVQERAQVQTASAAAVAPRTVTPDVPSSASVARSATVRNAINLNRINLIGVYGTSSNRRALVRLANGRYQKVKIGDRLDGGRVSAISDSELRYTKSGRSVTLKMPRG